MKQLPPPSPKPELSLLENSQPSGKLERSRMGERKGMRKREREREREVVVVIKFSRN